MRRASVTVIACKRFRALQGKRVSFTSRFGPCSRGNPRRGRRVGWPFLWLLSFGHAKENKAEGRSFEERPSSSPAGARPGQCQRRTEELSRRKNYLRFPHSR